MILSALNYLRCFGHCLADPERRRLLNAHRSRPVEQPAARKDALRAAIDYLMRAQEQSNDDGIGSYHLVDGWSASYPETTGYIIPTLFAAAEHLQWDQPRERALRAADWLLSIQRNDGGWQGGRMGEDRESVVFNTAQVIRGLLAAHDQTKRGEFLDACIRAGEWILGSQSRDGAWRQKNFLQAARVYDTYVSAPILRLHRITGDDRYRKAAMANLEWVLAQQWANGWFSNADNTEKHNDRPITHTIAYTIDGLIECAAHVRHDVMMDRGTRTANVLLEKFLKDGWLHGRYDGQWRGSESLITTGCAQLAICWAWLHRITGEARYQEGLTRMTDLLMAMQRANYAGPADAHGALSGSFPIWGRYENFAFPNWGTKYFADALLCAEGRLPRY